MLEDLAETAKRLEARGIFLGGPRHTFARVGRNQLIVLLDQGLTPDAKVLDIGCGCLRGGYWLIHFLNAGGYFGIEPNEAMLNAGLDSLFERDSLSVKKPSFSHNDDFRFSIFGERFDFFVARSIWTHAAPLQIQTMLDEFLRSAARDGVFLTSYREAGGGDQYAGAEWVGRSHTSNTPGVVDYNLTWIEEQCVERELEVVSLYEDTGQTWLKIFRKGEHRWRLDGEPADSQIERFKERPARKRVGAGPKFRQPAN